MEDPRPFGNSISGVYDDPGVRVLHGGLQCGWRWEHILSLPAVYSHSFQRPCEITPLFPVRQVGGRAFELQQSEASGLLRRLQEPQGLRPQGRPRHLHCREIRPEGGADEGGDANGDFCAGAAAGLHLSICKHAL
jgi:hypothetical protein